MRNVAIIPARAGSKGLADKNVANILGKSLIEYTLQAACKADVFQAIIVSTDDEKVMRVCENYPVICQERPSEFCTDNAGASDVVRYVVHVNKLERDDRICYLQPTSPLRDHLHIQRSMELFCEHKLPVVSVTPANEIPYKMFTLLNGTLDPLFSEEMTNMRRQDLPKVFKANGAIYIFSVGQFQVNDGFPSRGGVPFIMPANLSHDLDSESDKFLIENVMREML